MAFDLHIPENSQRGQAIQMIVAEQHITPEEALGKIVDDGLRATLNGKKTPAEEMWGAFSSDEDSAITDEAMKYVHAMRQTDRLRDFGV
jgi:hypothetical protein